MKGIISVLGAGESGTGAALLAQAKGFSVFVSDSANIPDKYKKILAEHAIDFEEGQHTEARLLEAELVVKSPGIPEKSEMVRKIIARGIPVISEIEFAGRYSKARFIAITGSNGKTTTSLLVYHLLKKLGLNVGLAGNVGESLAKQVIQDEKDYYVLELSSFQLDGMFDFKADISVLLNITPDHMDRYDYVFQNYVNSKFRIIQNMREQDFFITFIDDEVIKNELSGKEIAPSLLSMSLKDNVANGAYLSGDTIMVSFNNHQFDYFNLPTGVIPLKGKHNMVNSMAAVLVACILNLDVRQIPEAFADFKNASHRLEDAGSIKEVHFINDSKATNVDSVWYALDSMNTPVVLIAGGLDKGNDYVQIEGLVKEKVKSIVCMGVDNSKLFKAFEDKVKLIDTKSIETAVRAAYAIAVPGDTVLLSPACASFDLFKNYEDRGDQFKQQVLALKNEIENLSLQGTQGK